MTCAWLDDFGVEATIAANTKDISAGGLFINCKERPPAGSLANLEIRLPVRGLRGQSLQLYGTGRVVRMVADGDSSGFAVASTFSWTLARSKNQVAAKVS